MTSLYEKSEMSFAMAWIIIYVVGTSITDSMVNTKLATMLLHIILTAILVVWISKNSLHVKYGICKSKIKAKYFLYYIPLAVLASCNLWFGVRVNMPLDETIFYIVSMICVGFLEEVIFRGLLFRAMSKDGIKSAVIVSSITFGIGHIVNLINGIGADIISNLCQVCYAIAFGFMFVMIFYKGGSLVPCIITHSLINSFSAFADQSMRTNEINIALSAALCIIAIAYTFVINKNSQTEEV